MSFSPKPGCPMCGIVATAIHAPSHSPRSPSFPAGSTQPEVLWRDDNFTIYRERANPVSSKGHLIIVFNLHVPSLYMLSSSDLPLLVTIRDLSRRLLTSLIPASSPSSPNIQLTNVTTPVTAVTPQQLLNHPPTKPPSSQSDEFRIGFITPPFKDSKIPVTDHLHAHAYILPADRMGWWRSVGFGPLAWYSIDDLIAEIREETSNNRIRSGYTSSASSSSQPRPIDLVPAAGARSGTADGIETTEDGLAVDDPEDPEANPRRRSRVSTTSSTDSDTSSTYLTVGRRSTIGMTVDVSGVAAPYLGTGGALVMSPRSMMSEDGLRTPTGAGTATTNLLSPNSQIPHLRV